MQTTSSGAAAVQQQVAKVVSSTVERKQRMVNAGSAVDSDIKISEQRRRRKKTGNGSFGHQSAAKDKGADSESGQGTQCDQKVSPRHGELGSKIDIKV